MRATALIARSSLASLAAMLALGGSLAVAGDVYMWKDSNCPARKECVHYSDVPVEGAVLVKRAGVSLNEETRAANAAAERDRLAGRSSQITDQLENDGAARGVESDIAKKRQQQCKEATERYDRSISARRLFKEGKGGERIYLTEDELKAARVAARAERDSACGTSAG